MIKEHDIELNIYRSNQNYEIKNEGEIKFDANKLIFIYLNNWERNLKTSGIQNLYDLLSNEYNSVEHSVSTTLKHKNVHEQIEKEKKNKKTFVDTQLLFKSLKHGNENESNFSNFDVPQTLSELEDILCDLHKLGVILFFKSPTLKNTIICDPIWINNVFKQILDHGRIKIAKIIEKIIEIIDENEKGNRKSNIKQKLQEKLNWLKGNADKNLSINEIEDSDEELEKSRINKISFGNLMNDLFKFQNQLIDEGKLDLIKKTIPRVDTNKQYQNDLCQLVYTIYYNSKNVQFNAVVDLINHMISMKDRTNKKMKKFIENLLAKFNILIPQTKLKFHRGDGERYEKKVTPYLIPLLFP